MKRFGTVIALAICLLPQGLSAQFISPGPLAADHAKVDGPLDCNKCHASGKKVSENQCLACHKELGARVSAGLGLHGVKYKGKACGECHIDHLGRKAVLVKWPGGKRDSFKHDDAQWHLNGKHANTSCTGCHTRKNTMGRPMFLGAKSACVDCHKDPHDNRFGGKCLDCHNENAWKEVKISNFNHDMTRYPLKGAHKKVECAQCHKGTPPKYKPLEFQKCTDCHRDPHQGKFPQACTSCHVETSWKDVTSAIRKNHPGVSLGNGHSNVKCETCHDQGNEKPPTKGKECVSCHKPVHKAKFGKDCADCHRSIEWLGLPRDIGLRSHKLTEYHLVGKHQDVSCGSCHKSMWPVAKRYRGLEFKQCRSCHEDKHKGEFVQRDQGECAQCHNENGYRPSLFDFKMHETTAFAITGKHAAVPCGNCHTAKPPRLDLHLNKKICADCHENPHGTQFAKELAEGGCAHCHVTTGWQNAKIDHSIWPLTGAHLTAPCTGCHTPSEADKKLGRGASYRGVPRMCEGCHEDIHAAQFRASAPIKKCDACHSTSDEFKLPKFSHQKETGYPLTGKHAALECGKCHLQEKLKNKETVVRYRLGYRECRDCHANPHAMKKAGT